jgi:syntaxin 5
LNYLQNRAQSVEQVEKQMAEVAEMMQKIALLVHEQQSTIDRIDMNTEKSLENLQIAKSEIDKYYMSVTSNRNLGIKVFMIFVIFFVFYVVFLV